MPQKYQVVIAFLGLSGLALVYGLYDPESSVFFPKCPFFWATGWQCAGCGSQRAMHHLLHADIGKAFGLNPLMVLSIPYLLVGFYVEGYRHQYPKLRNILVGRWAIITWVIIIVTFWIARNLY
jgi:hypothetical protein